MELADNLDEKRNSYIKPEKFDPRFGDSKYLQTEGAKHRLRGYLRTFAYMTFCGLLLLIGGGSFFIYESIIMNQKTQVDEQGYQMDELVVRERESYSRDFRIAGFTFIAIGAIFVIVGGPLTSEFYKRYKRAKEVERSPILDPLAKESKGRIYTGDLSKLNSQSGGSPRSPVSFMNKKKFRTKNDKWMYSSPEKFAEDGFRFAAHRHPSMNPIQLDGSEIFGRNFSDDTSPTSSEEDVRPGDGRAPRTLQIANGVRGFINKLFTRNDENDARLRTEKQQKADDETVSNQFLAVSQSRRNTRGNDLGPKFDIVEGKSGYEILKSEDTDADLTSSQCGLYNLQ